MRRGRKKYEGGGCVCMVPSSGCGKNINFGGAVDHK